MDKQQVEKIWDDVVTETGNRSKGAFKRALWFGNDNRLLGQNKGLRKALRNAPRALSTDLLGLASIPPGLNVMVTSAVDVILNRGKDVYSDQIKPLIRNKPISAEEAMRKNIKHSVKDLKSNAFQVIDRNLVKLANAKNKVSPAVQALMTSVSHISYTHVPSNVAVVSNEEQVKKAHETLRTIAETEYYIDKVMRLVATLKLALTDVEKDLNKLQEATQKTRQEVMDYIEAAID